MALVDDPVVLVDDSGTLVGNQTTIFKGTRVKVNIPKVFTKIRKRR